jgi:DNA-binding transcriptional LysR family regulator
MGLTQSAVSRLITQLEDELGLSIFDRRHGRLQITPEGQHFYDIARKVLDGIDQINATARDIRMLQAGALRILSMPALAYGLLPRTIGKINAQYKQVKISVGVGSRAELEDGIASAQYDVGIATLPVDQQGIEVEPLCAVDCVAIVPMDHPLAAKAVIAARDLAGEPFVSLTSGTLFRYRVDEVFATLGIRRGMLVEVPSTIMVSELVASGIGVSVVHPFVAAAFRDNVVTKRFDPAIKLEYGLLFPASQTKSLLTRTFVDVIRADIAETYGSPSS